MKHVLTRISGVIVVVLGGACDAEPLAERVPEFTLELGTFEGGRFSPYGEHAEEEIERGLQGGHHIFVDGRLRGEPPDDSVLVGLELVDPSGDSIASIEHLREPWLEDEDGELTLPEMIIYVDEPSSLSSARLELFGWATYAQSEGVPDPTRASLVLRY